jgi:HK97 family phage portal protein
MATIWQRLSGKRERAISPNIPPRSATVANPETALTLTAVTRALAILGTPISKLDLRTVRYAGGSESVITNPIFVNRPSIQETRRELMYQLVIDLAMYGNAYLLKQYDNRGQIIQVFQLSATGVAVNWAENNIDKEYTYNGKTYTADVIEHIRLMPRSGRLLGLSIMELARDDIKAALDLRDYQANWFSASGVPTGVIKSSKDLTKDDADAMTVAWHTKQQQRQVAVLGNGFDYQQISLSPKDAELYSATSQVVQNIARMFGIPARLLLTGIDGTSDTYSNLTDEDAIFLRHTITAYTDCIADALSNCLPRGTKVEFDFSKLFSADPKSRYEMYSIALNGESFMTVDEVRNREGLNG